MSAAGVRYRVYVTPLYSAFVYGTEVEISDLVENVAGTIDSSIDSTDYSVGITTFNDVSLTCENSQGFLADQSDSRSLFQFGRDRAKVRIVFDNGTSTPPTTYRGVISDDATAVNSDTDEVVLTLLGPDSVLKNSIVPAGTVTAGMTVAQAMIAILNSSDIRSVLKISLSNINPSNNVTIDVGAHFDNLAKNTAITDLLSVSNSVMLIDPNLNVIIRNRAPGFQNPILYIFGKADPSGTEGIVSIQNYNTGLQRTFNSAVVTGGQNSTTVSGTSVSQPKQLGYSNNLPSQAIYGVRQKQISFDFITTLATLQAIAAGYTGEFSFPKIELQIVVPTAQAATAQLLDEVSVSYPLQVTRAGKFTPIIGITVIGDVNSPLPYVKGAIAISSQLGFKIIEKTEDITSYQTTLKLRQIGTTQTDGGLIVPLNTTTVTNALSPYQITTANDIILVDCTAGAVQVMLPSPAALPQKAYTVIKIDTTANLATVAPFAAELINGLSSLTLATQYDSAQFGTDQVNWYSFARAPQPIQKIAVSAFTLTNNQSSAANVTGLLLSSALYREATIVADVKRATAASEVRATHYLSCTYNAFAGTWSMTDEAEGDADGVVFSITAGGQVQYTTTNIASTTVNNVYFNAGVISV